MSFPVDLCLMHAILIYKNIRFASRYHWANLIFFENQSRAPETKLSLEFSTSTAIKPKKIKN
jgi:hypothetical protein